MKPGKKARRRGWKRITAIVLLLIPVVGFALLWFDEPEPVTNEEFTHTLGKVLGRPTSFAVPAMVLHAMFGQMAEEVLLGGARVLPEKLQQIGFPFRYPELEPALRVALQE